MKRASQDSYPAGSAGGGYSNMKGCMMEEQADAGVDELLAALGYKVRSSEMADVAQKLEQLEMAMGGNGAASLSDENTLVNQLSDTVHYNPSDLSSWLESMLTELNAPPSPLPEPITPQIHSQIYLAPVPPASSFIDPAESSTITTAVYEVTDQPTKRMRTSSPASSSSGGSVASKTEASSVVTVDPQEAGIRLIHALMACAEAVQEDNFKAADVLVKQIPALAASQGGSMRKVAGYFAEALARRIYRLHPQQDCSLDSAFADILHMHFYESCPYLKFAHFTANQAILEAFAGCRRVHVIDFGMKQGMQWPALMQALALRPGGPPTFRLTGIGPPQPDNTDALQQVGWKLAQLADAIHVDFEYRGFVASSLADLEPYMLEVATVEPEAVAVNSVLELHRLLGRQGALEKVLATVRLIKPRIVTVVEQEASHNGAQFVERFTESLHYYSTMFDSLEGGVTVGTEQQHDQLMSEVYLGRQICNVVACEGAERTERHENLVQWRGRLSNAGFEPVHLGSNAFKQASTLLALFAGGDGYRVEEKEGCLTLGWHTRPLIATSAWRPASGESSAGAVLN